MRLLDSEAAASQGGSGTDNGGESSGGTNAQLRCSVPPEVKAFAGLGAKLAVSSGSATDAVLLPVTAVEGRFEQGFVYMVTKEAEEEILTAAKPETLAKRVPVKLGITNGDQIQILDGVKPGTSVLTFVPGSDQDGEQMGMDATGEENYVG